MVLHVISINMYTCQVMIGNRAILDDIRYYFWLLKLQCNRMASANHVSPKKNPYHLILDFVV
ncbi:hypothetical protein LOK49_LG01G01141 [Camellia lanceoleosa]|uniref:Uncharacterized protein n=1 Tax=Camellia lanceoleosa TaxID=1840588 RepID=A0ACC0IXI5_9ERIC|nr:hypothetical protein LOK49_LG01G01141 [Camellia lanceoleosa]